MFSPFKFVNFSRLFIVAIQILSRRTKNNPVLIGDPGVGKTGTFIIYCLKFLFDYAIDGSKNLHMLAFSPFATIEQPSLRVLHNVWSQGMFRTV
jgi:hypothetical protein